MLILELAMLYDDALVHFRNLNRTKLKDNANKSARIAVKLERNPAAARYAALIRNMEVQSRKMTKRGRFTVLNKQT